MQNQKGIGSYYVYHNIISYQYLVCVCLSFTGLFPTCKIASSQLVSGKWYTDGGRCFLYFDYGIIYLFVAKLFYMHLYYVGLVAYSCSSCCDPWDSHPSVQHSPCVLWWIQVHKIYFIDNYLLLSVSRCYFHVVDSRTMLLILGDWQLSATQVATRVFLALCVILIHVY